MPPSNKPQKRNVKAEKLKKQGNERHAKGQYSAAYKKYSEAIAEDPTDANLWANRAASSLAMNKFMDTISDAQKAVELDPKHHKAFSRLGEASCKLSLWPQSVQAYKFAVELLPLQGSLTSQEQQLKKFYTEGLKNAEAGLKKPGSKYTIGCRTDPEFKEYPWIRALVVSNNMVKNEQPKQSSAFVMAAAYEVFQLGVEKLDVKQAVLAPGAQVVQVPDRGSIEHLSNALTRDTRVFHCPFIEFLGVLNDTTLNTQLAKAWTYTGLSRIKAEAPARQFRNGWSDVSVALTITVRSWILKGYIQEGVELVSTDFYRNALDVLEWGRRVWKDVPTSSRGIIFERSFVRGVQRLCLRSLIDAHVYQRRAPRNETIEDIAKLAQQILVDVEDDPYHWEKPGDRLWGWPQYASFWVYPKAEAYAALGWFQRQCADIEADTMQRVRLLRKSATYYVQAANTFPQDDEHVAGCIATAIDALFHFGAPLRLTLPLCERVRLALPEINQIWKKCPTSKGIRDTASQVLRFEAEYRAKIQRGHVTMDSIVSRPGVVPLFRQNLPKEFGEPLSFDECSRLSS